MRTIYSIVKDAGIEISSVGKTENAGYIQYLYDVKLKNGGKSIYDISIDMNEKQIKMTEHINVNGIFHLTFKDFYKYNF